MKKSVTRKSARINVNTYAGWDSSIIWFLRARPAVFGYGATLKAGLNKGQIERGRILLQANFDQN